MCIEANKHRGQENSTMIHKENNNKPGLALFTLDYELYDNIYTYITALPFNGKLRKYIYRINEEAALIRGLANDAESLTIIYMDMLVFDTYAEAKAAARGAISMNVEENSGMSPIGDEADVDAEKLQKAIEIMKRIRKNTQLTGDYDQDKKKARDAVIAVSCETGLWCNVND